MAIISNGTTVASGGNLEASRLTGTASAFNGSNITNLPSSAPTNSQILTGVASATAGSVGSYICMSTGGYSKGVDTTFSTNNAMYYSNMKNLYVGQSGGGFGEIQPSGTYRTMGQTSANDNNGANATVFLRIS